jgi:hypothetical protein
MSLFLGGRPTEPEVRMLLEKFKGVDRGDIIRAEDLEEALGIERKASRFRVVIEAFKKALDRQRGFALRWEKGVGLRVLKEGERARHGAEMARTGARRMGRGAAVVAKASPALMSEKERDVNMRTGRLLNAALESMRGTMRDLVQTFDPPKQLPRLVPDEPKAAANGSKA